MDTIKIDDFLKLDIRIGTVIKAEVPEWSHWVMKLTVDIGPPDTVGDPSTHSTRSGRQSNTIVVFAGIMKHYKPKQIKGKQMPFVVNMEPKKIGPKGDYSQGMMMAAAPAVQKHSDGGQADSSEGESKPVLFKLTEKVLNGTKVR